MFLIIFDILFLSKFLKVLSMEINMDKKYEHQIYDKKNEEKFNSITQKKEPENQNQHHNVKKEGVDAKRRQV